MITVIVERNIFTCEHFDTFIRTDTTKLLEMTEKCRKMYFTFVLVEGGWECVKKLASIVVELDSNKDDTQLTLYHQVPALLEGITCIWFAFHIIL